MGLLDWVRGSKEPTPQKRAPVQIGPSFNSMADTSLEEYLLGQTVGSRTVTADNAMKISAVWRCVSLISGNVATLPLDLKRRVGETRVDADDHDLWTILRRKPNRWQTPAEFRRMLQMSVLLRGNGYAYKVTSGKKIIELIPLNADNVEVKQERDLSLTYTVTLPSGQRTILKQDKMLHLRGMTFDGIVGLPVITYAQEAMGLAASTEQHAGALFRNGTRAGGVIKHPGSLGEEGQVALRESLDYYRSGAALEGRDLILEEGMDYQRLSMTSVDAQFIQTRVQSLAEIAMYFGVPLHMVGLNDKASSWGTGIEQMGIGFVTYTMQDWLTMWEQAIARDLIDESEPDLYARFNNAALLKGDTKSRYEAYAIGRNSGFLSANDIRALEDMDPIEGGDTYLEPLNMTPLGEQPTTADAPTQD
ncbi:phage portal protein [Mesorhizobium sp. CAU 1732]|uniref:phage portal protein n=1 Tax=Mesorhizobium sp. CAU 1732 TaxID=3140358 RepID=UPI00326015A3